MKKLSLKTFQRYLNAADSMSGRGIDDFIILTKNGKERKFPVSLFDEHIKSIKEKYKTNQNEKF